jgi:hypothetical protein
MGGKAQKELTDEQQRFIVQLLACFCTPSQVVEEVRKSFRLKIDRQRVEHYDPTKVAGRNLRDDLETLFNETRTAYLEKANTIGISHQVYRLDQLHEMFVEARKDGNSGEARSCLEQAAKELGDVFTNKHEVKVNARDALAALLGVPPDELPAPTNSNAKS